MIIVISISCAWVLCIALVITFIVMRKRSSRGKPGGDAAIGKVGDVATGKFPPDALTTIKAASGLVEPQIDRIMQLIMNFEQSDTRWWLYYGYCRALSYDYSKAWRGTTVSLYGATTYNNNPEADAARLFKQYGKGIKELGWISDKTCCQMPGCKGEKYWTIGTTGKASDWEAANLQQLNASCQFCKNLAALNDSAAWRTAVWKAFAAEYFMPTIAELKKHGYPMKAAVVGFAVDFALNEGMDDLLSGVKRAGKSIAALVAHRAKSGSCCNGSAANAKKRAEMWGEAIAKNPDLANDVAALAAKYKPE